MSKGDPSNSTVVVDTQHTTTAQNPTAPASSPTGTSNITEHDPTSEIKLIPNPTGMNPQILNPGAPMSSAPIGSVPILRPEQLVEFHPRLPDFTMSKVQVTDNKDEAQSIIFFKYRQDTTRVLRSIIMDVNEKASGKLIYEMSQMAHKKEESRVVEGESITSHYLEINGMPAIKAFIPSKNAATLYILVGDHRAVSLHEYRVKSTDHIVEAAKTIDFKKLETLKRK